MNLHRLLILMVVLITLVAYASVSSDAGDTIAISTAIPTEAIAATATPTVDVVPTVIPTITVTPLSTSIANVAPACPPRGADEPRSQIGVAGVFPGVTSGQELLELFGEPTFFSQIGTITKEYIYEAIPITPERSVRVKFYTQRDIVDLAFPHGWMAPTDIADPTTGATIQDVINTFGCPDFVYLRTLGMHARSSEPYNSGLIVYLQEGMEFAFFSVPLALDTPIEYTSLSVPRTFEQYIAEDHVGNHRPVVTWEEATAWQYGQPQ